MKTARSAMLFVCVLSTFVLSPLGVDCGSEIADSVPLPTVIKAAVPIYPEVLRKGHFDGTVTLTVKTDGQAVASVRALNGQAMLVDAAKANVDTWVFRVHEPVTFNVVFRYVLLPATCDSQCNCSSKERPYVMLRLPTSVEVAGEESLICDPAVTTRP
jgi:hypothetical protein